METLVIDKYKRLVLLDDCLIILRTDVVSVQFKEQGFDYENIKNVILSHKEYFWGRFLTFLGLAILLDGSTPNVDGERERIKLIFKNGTFRFIDCSNLEMKEKQHIRDKILFALNYWRQKNNAELL